MRGYLKEADLEVPKSCDQPVQKKGRPRDQSSLVDFFFMELYNSAGEPLAKHRAKSVKTTESDADVFMFDDPWLTANDNLNPEDSEHKLHLALFRA
jgi:hypothetical protein